MAVVKNRPTGDNWREGESAKPQALESYLKPNLVFTQ